MKDEGDGGEIEGFPAHRYAVDSSYDVNVKIMGQEISNHIEMKSEGLPLKQIMTSTTTSSRGGSRSWTTKTTVSGVHETAAAESDFDVPTGYKKSEMPRPGNP